MGARFPAADAVPAAALVTPNAVTPNAEAGWQQLVLGNARFVAGESAHPHAAADWRSSLVTAQHPVACVLGCIDSRVPPELVFDQGFGDLLTVRTAGEVLDEAVIGSVEYGVDHLGVPLVVVLGHAGCGAVAATVEAVQGGTRPNGDVAAIVHAIEPAVRAAPADDDAAAYLKLCVAEQARQVATALAERSLVLANAVTAGRVSIVPAVYDLADGKVNRLN